MSADETSEPSFFRSSPCRCRSTNARNASRRVGSSLRRAPRKARAIVELAAVSSPRACATTARSSPLGSPGLSYFFFGPVGIAGARKASHRRRVPATFPGMRDVIEETSESLCLTDSTALRGLGGGSVSNRRRAGRAPRTVPSSPSPVGRRDRRLPPPRIELARPSFLRDRGHQLRHDGGG